nr:BTB POZ domain-containing [Megavirus caiporensis]
MPYYLFYYGDYKKMKHIICYAKNKKKLYDYLINNVKKFGKFFQMMAFSSCELFDELYNGLEKLSNDPISDEIIELLRNGLKEIDYNYFFDNITSIGGDSHNIDDVIFIGFKKIRSKNFLKINEK